MTEEYSNGRSSESLSRWLRWLVSIDALSLTDSKFSSLTVVGISDSYSIVTLIGGGLAPPTVKSVSWGKGG